MRFSVAADGSRWLESRSIRRSADRTGQLVPAGDSHAVPEGADETLCGLAADSLASFPEIDFERASFVRKCRDCRSLLPAP